MSNTIDSQAFDLAMRVLNYAIEFVNLPGYSSLRLTDVLQGLVDLYFQMDSISNKKFYEKIRKKFDERKLMSDPEDSTKFLDELLTMFVNEWREKKAN